MTYKLPKPVVCETTTTTGTGTISLAGAKSGYQGIVAALGTGSRGTFHRTNVPYGGTDWEEFEGVVTDASPDTLTRAVVKGSSNGGSLVDFPALTCDVYQVIAAEEMVAEVTHRLESDQAGFTNTDTVISDLTHPVQAGENWDFEYVVRLNTSATQGVRLKWSAPGGYTLAVHEQWGSGASVDAAKAGAAGEGGNGPTFQLFAGLSAVLVKASLRNAAAGNVELLGNSQNSGNTVTPKAGSRVKATRVP